MWLLSTSIPSFLVKKPHGGIQLLTAFTEIDQYCKPQPSLMPDINSTLGTIATWKFVICTDLKSAFYQILLSWESMKYCGVCTPFKGIRVYQRAAMGMPSSETALEELMCRVLGDLIIVAGSATIADDVYIGWQSPDDLLHNWKAFLFAMEKNSVRLSADHHCSKEHDHPWLGVEGRNHYDTATSRCCPGFLSSSNNCQELEGIYRSLQGSVTGAYTLCSNI